MIWICLGLASGTCDGFALILIAALVAFVLATVVGFILSLASFIFHSLDGIVGCLVPTSIVSFIVFFIGGLIYMGGH